MLTRTGTSRRRAGAARATALLLGAGVVAAACSSGAPSGSKATTTSKGGNSTSTSSTTSTTTVSTASTTSTTTTTLPAPPAGGAVAAGFEPASVTFVSSATGFVLGAGSCGAHCLAIARTENGGATWVGLDAPSAAFVASNESASATGQAVGEVRFADQLDGWAFGPSLYATHDGGRTWSSIDLGGAVVSLETSDGVVDAVVSPCAPGSTCTGSYRLEQAPATGGAWQTVLTGPSEQAGTGVSQYLSLQRGTGFVLLGYGYRTPSAFYATANVASGHGWNAFPDPCAGTGLALTSFVAPDTSSLYSLCTGDPAAGNTSKVVTLTEGGRTHTVGHAPTPGDGGTVTATPTGDVVVASWSGGSMLYRSGDGGSEWATAAFFGDGGAGLFDLGFTTATQGVVVHGLPGELPGVGSTLLVTHDAGQSWQTVTI